MPEGNRTNHTYNQQPTDESGNWARKEGRTFPPAADPTEADYVGLIDRNERYFESLDQPDHALNYGGRNELATIRGVPLRSQVNNPGLEIYFEPVPVLLRDVVTVDTAVRLTGCSRESLQHAAYHGRLPVLKTGPGTGPYLVRLRDVFTYLLTMQYQARNRRDMPGGDTYLGFQSWLVERIEEHWPKGRPYIPGRWEGRKVKINRGGRPKGYSPGMVFSVHGKRLGRPPKEGWPEDRGEDVEKVHVPAPESKKGETPGRDHPQVTAQAPPPVAAPAPPPPNETVAEPQEPPLDPTALPKWHPLWQRSRTSPGP